MRIPVLMFDFGNVVGFFDYSPMFHRFGLKLGLSAQQFESMMYERARPGWAVSSRAAGSPPSSSPAR